MTSRYFWYSLCKRFYSLCRPVKCDYVAHSQILLQLSIKLRLQLMLYLMKDHHFLAIHTPNRQFLSFGERPLSLP